VGAARAPGDIAGGRGVLVGAVAVVVVVAVVLVDALEDVPKSAKYNGTIPWGHPGQKH
jgi:hypothetical protein